ncbi:MAG TPA: hypothetical protein PK547_00130 [Candidatus Paceibacterota bacterium]|nr:hypothetical protein [Candidatus Paceibacterota bacterium]
MVLAKSQQQKLKQAYPVISKLCMLFGFSEIELMMTVLGYKPAMSDEMVFTHKLEKNINKIKDYARQIDLYLATSKCKYIVNSPLGIFQEIPLSDSREGDIILALAPTMDRARKGADYYHAKMIDGRYGYKFGKLMGYPECCLRFGNYLQNVQGNPNNFGFKNPAIESLKRSKHFDWHLNVFTVSLLPYYPCNLTCKKSITYVDEIFACLDYIDKKRSSLFKDCKKQAASLYWTLMDKIFLWGSFKRYTMGTGEIKYNKIESKIYSDTYYQKVDKKLINQWRDIAEILSKGNKLVVTDNLLTIYFNKKKLFETKKENKYVPVLVKPDR